MNRLAAESLPKQRVTPEALTELPPIAVDLGERAAALVAIMDYLNYAAKTVGAKNAGTAFANRYGDRAPTVLRGMDDRRNELRLGFDDALDTLIAGPALRAHGFGDEEIEKLRLAMQAAVNRRFGVGQTNSRNRAAAVSRAKKIASPPA
ncbi:MAG TPA: hypothetical protein VIQ80_01670 [Candidatus Saccharimonadales bacterium]